MDLLWLSAPGLAIRLQPQQAGAPSWRLNPAATDWSRTRQVGVADWATFATSLCAQLTGQQRGDRPTVEGRLTLGVPAIELTWTAVALPPGWLVWLSADRAEVDRLGNQLESVQQLAHIGLWELDLQHGVGRWDAHMFRLLGMQPTDGAPPFEVLTQRMHPDDRERVMQEHQRFAQQLGRHETHFRLMTAMGDYMDVQGLLEVHAGADGRPQRMSGVLMDDTRSAQLLRATEASAARWMRAVDLAGVSTWRVNMSTRRADFSDSGYRLLGREPDPAGQSIEGILQSVHPDDRAAVEGAAAEAMASDRIVDVEARYRMQDGSYRYLLTRRVAERDAQQRVVALSGVSLDINERVLRRQKSEAFVRRMTTVTNAAGVGIWSTDVETNAAEWNHPMFKLYGLDPQNGPPEPRVWLRELVHPDDREKARDYRIAVTAGHAGHHGLQGDFRIVRPDGAVRWVSAWSRREVLAGRVTLFGTNLDITNLQWAQVELRQAQERAHLAAESAGIGTWERDMRTGHSKWDAQMYRLRGLPPGPEELPAEGRHVAAYHPDDIAAIHQARERAGHGGNGDDCLDSEFRVIYPDGSVHWLAARGVVKRGDDGKPERMLGITWDITERRRAEQALREKAAAEQSSQAKSQFLARMSHELRTPLNAVLGFAQLLGHDETDPLSPAQQQRVDRIRSAGLHLLALIDDVLDLATIESDTLTLARDAVSLQQAMDDVLQWTQLQAKQNGVAVHVRAMPGWVRADPRRVRQIISNLLSNAIKYNRRGGEVWISAQPCLHNAEDAWRVCVRDSGRGLSVEQSRHLFEPFNRLGAERSNIQGTGIGLAIVRHLVRLMGGEVTACSEPGQGSEFCVTLPATDPQDGSDHAPLSGYYDDLAVAEMPSRLSLLYIEDNPINVLLVEELVAMRSDMQLQVAVDGLSGVEVARAQRPDVVLIDMQLPDIDGFEVLRRLRAEPLLSGTTMVALSANAMPDDVNRARAAGFDDYWTKPLDVLELAGRLADALARHAGR